MLVEALNEYVNLDVINISVTIDWWWSHPPR